MSETTFHYAITNQEIIGLVGWFGTIIGTVSFFVTVAGFWIALVQIKKVKRSSDAAREAAFNTAKSVRAKEQSAKLSNSITAIRSASSHISQQKFEVATAYLDYCCTLLVDAMQLSQDNQIQEDISNQLIVLRKIAENLEMNGQKTVAKSVNINLRKTISEVEVIASKLHYSFEEVRGI